MDYSDFLQIEQFSHQKLGGFKPNSLFTRTVEAADLQPSNRMPFDAALPIHIHEYIHFLHNLSTPSGVVFLFNGLNFFFEFMRGTDHHGAYESQSHPQGSAQAFLKIYSLLQGQLVGELPPPEVKIKCWEFGAPMTEKVPLTILDHKFDSFNKTCIDVKSTSYYGSSYEFTLELGIHFITEGIAYEVDRENRRKIGAWNNLDEHTPAYPYLAYQPLIDSLVGRETSLYERIILGTCALLEMSPGKGLLHACEMLKTEKATYSRGFIEYVLELKKSLELFRQDLLNNVMPNMIYNFRGSNTLQAGVKEYLKLISKSLAERCFTPFMELSFIHITSPDVFFRKIADLVPQWICQEKPNGKAEISLIGHPDAVNVIDEVAISALQSAFHYVQLHLKADGRIIGTKEIPRTHCPFSGGCQAQLQGDNLQVCNQAPWNTQFPEQDGIKNPTCFYNLGVRSLYYESSSSA